MNNTMLIVYALAVFRASQLVTHDYLFARTRDKLIRLGYRIGRRDLAETERRAQEHGGIITTKPGAWAEVVELDDAPPKAAYIWTCPWCASIWVAAGAEWARLTQPLWAGRIAAVLAASAVAALIARYAND